MTSSDNVKLTATGLYFRLRQAREMIGISRSELARRIGVQPSAAIQWEQEHGTHPSTAHLIHIASLTSVAFEWLATGRGAARWEQNTLAPEAVAMDLLEESLLKLVRKLPLAGRISLITFLKSLNEE